MRILRWAFAVGLLAISYGLFSRVEWSYELRARDGVSAAEIKVGPLWSAPPAPSYAELRMEFAEMHPDSTPGVVVHRAVSDWLPFEWTFCTGAYSGLIGLIYLAIRRQRRDPALGVCLSAGVPLFVFSLADGFLWG